MTVRRRRRPGTTTPVLVDASIAVQWFANEPGSEAAARLLDLDGPLLAPDLMAAEAANAWWKKVRRREMDAPDFSQAVLHLLSLDIDWIPSSALIDRAAGLAVDLKHPVYDCLYLAAAAKHAVTLATADEQLRTLARSLDIDIWTPES